MTYKRLSEQMRELANSQRSDAFLRQFREAVRQGHFEATFLPERFTLPKHFSRRGAGSTYQRETKDMIFEVTPEFETWFTRTNQDLAATRRARVVKPSVEAFEAGRLDFKALAADTRQRMQARFDKGQTLGRNRAKTFAETGGGRKGKKAGAE